VYGFPSSGQKIEAAGFSETLAAICQITPYHIRGSNLLVGFEVLTAVIIKSFLFSGI
jgi:hypothetical protein